MRTSHHRSDELDRRFSPDGSQLATGSIASKLTVKVWDTAGGQLIDARTRRVGTIAKLGSAPVRGNVGAIYGLAFHGAGLRVASNKDQRVAEVWEPTADEDAVLTLMDDVGSVLRYMLYTAVTVIGVVWLSRAARWNTQAAACS